MFGYGSCWGKGMNTANEVPHRECQFVYLCACEVCAYVLFTHHLFLCVPRHSQVHSMLLLIKLPSLRFSAGFYSQNSQLACLLER